MGDNTSRDEAFHPPTAAVVRDAAEEQLRGWLQNRDQVKISRNRHTNLLSILSATSISALVSIISTYVLIASKGPIDSIPWLTVVSFGSATFGVVSVVATLYAYSIQYRRSRRAESGFVRQTLRRALTDLKSVDQDRRASARETIKAMMEVGTLDDWELYLARLELEKPSENQELWSAGPNGRLAWSRATEEIMERGRAS